MGEAGQDAAGIWRAVDAAWPSVLQLRAALAYDTQSSSVQAAIGKAGDISLLRQLRRERLESALHIRAPIDARHRLLDLLGNAVNLTHQVMHEPADYILEHQRGRAAIGRRSGSLAGWPAHRHFQRRRALAVV